MSRKKDIEKILAAQPPCCTTLEDSRAQLEQLTSRKLRAISERVSGKPCADGHRITDMADSRKEFLQRVRAFIGSDRRFSPQ